MIEVSEEQDVHSIYWLPLSPVGWLTPCEPLRLDYQVAKMMDWREAAIGVDLGSEDAYADIPPSPEAEYAARAGAETMKGWMKENPA
jgi:hypothetical protein